MNPVAVFVSALMCAGLIYMFYDGWYNSTSHTDVEDPSKLRSTAKIKDIKTERAVRKQSLTACTLEVNRETVMEIVVEAAAAHHDMVLKYSTSA